MSQLSWIVLVAVVLVMFLLQQIVNRLGQIAGRLEAIQSQVLQIINTLDREFPRDLHGRRMDPGPRVPYPLRDG